MMSALLPTFGLVLRQFYLLRGSLPRFLQTFIWLAVDMVLWGFLTHYLNGVAAARVNFVTVILGAVLLWDIFIRILQGVSMAYMEDNWSRNLFNVFVSPVTMGGYLGGLVISSLLTSIAGILIILFLAVGVFGLSLLSYGLALIPFMAIILLFGIALGIFSCGLMMRLGPAAEWLVWPIPAIISPFVGVFYPLSVLPEWMQVVGHAFPPTYVFENIRDIVAGTPVSSGDMITGLALAVAYVGAACIFFMAVFQRALRMGSIARYSAESF
jgi:ABC-2 type transport system permease protein